MWILESQFARILFSIWNKRWGEGFCVAIIFCILQVGSQFVAFRKMSATLKVVYIGMTRPPLTLIKIFVSPPERNFWLKNRTLLSDRFE